MFGSFTKGRLYRPGDIQVQFGVEIALYLVVEPFEIPTNTRNTSTVGTKFIGLLAEYWSDRWTIIQVAQDRIPPSGRTSNFTKLVFDHTLSNETFEIGVVEYFD